MNRRKQRANGRTGLWQDTPDTGFTPAEQLPAELDGPTPFTRRCPHCHAAPRQPCTFPSRRRGGRRNLPGYHPARIENPQVNASQEVPKVADPQENP